MDEARRLVAATPFGVEDVQRWFRSGAPETRVAALGLMQGDARLRDPDAAIETIERPSSAFEQYHGLVLAWTDRSTGRVLVRRSSDAGATFLPIQRLGRTSVFESGVKVAVSGERAYIVWEPKHSSRYAYLPHSIVMRRSSDGGATWRPRQTSSNANGRHETGPRISASGRVVLVLYTVEPVTKRLARSVDGGATFTTMPIDARLGSAWTADVAIDRAQARLALDNGLSWRVLGSADGGATWGPLAAAPSIRGRPTPGAGEPRPQLSGEIPPPGDARVADGRGYTWYGFGAEHQALSVWTERQPRRS
jgi:hypothetical protein